MIINANTKIASILKHNNAALDAIVSLTPKFEKLRNPLLRKLMAARTSIAMACKISGCRMEEFFEKLKPLGFEIDVLSGPVKESPPQVPGFFNNLTPAQIEPLDVRPVIEAGKDPLSLIHQKINSLKSGHALKIINSFEPTPLLSLLKKQGFDYYVDTINDQLVETYFFKGDKQQGSVDETTDAAEGLDYYFKKYKENLDTIDVRHLPMPQPMMTILQGLEKLAPDRALFVYHKKVPVFLLPELRDRGFDFRIKETGEGLINLLIFKE